MSTSSVEAGGPGAPGGASPTKDRTADVVITIIELIVLGLGGLALSVMGFFLVFASDSCGVAETECSTGQIALGVAVASGGPWVVILAMGGWAVVRMVRRRSAWWVPLLAVPGCALVFALGVALTFSAVD